MFKIKGVILVSFFWLISSYSTLVFSNLEKDIHKDIHIQEFEKIFTEWSLAFNQKDLNKTCALFSRSVVANYQNVPAKNYDALCKGFKDVFQQDEKQYHYHFKLNNVYVSGNLAVARITWYLKVTEKGKVISTVQDEGIDVFQKNSEGDWEIINYLAYPVS